MTPALALGEPKTAISALDLPKIYTHCFCGKSLDAECAACSPKPKRRRRQKPAKGE